MSPDTGGSPSGLQLSLPHLGGVAQVIEIRGRGDAHGVRGRRFEQGAAVWTHRNAATVPSAILSTLGTKDNRAERSHT